MTDITKERPKIAQIFIKYGLRTDQRAISKIVALLEQSISKAVKAENKTINELDDLIGTLSFNPENEKVVEKMTMVILEHQGVVVTNKPGIKALTKERTE